MALHDSHPSSLSSLSASVTVALPLCRHMDVGDLIDLLGDHLMQHIAACAIIVFGSYVMLLVICDAEFAVMAAAGLALLAGIGKEVGDWLEWWPWCAQRKCRWDERDLLADAIGILLALGLICTCFGGGQRLSTQTADERQPLASGT